MRAMLLIAIFLIAAAPAGADERSLGTLETRRHSVRISAAEPPRYTVMDREGRVILGDATLDELAARFPAAHHTLLRGLAGAQDARLR